MSKLTVVAPATDDETSERGVSMVLTRAEREITVIRMFDFQGQETFDPSEAAEIETDDGELLELQAGDRIDMAVEVET